MIEHIFADCYCIRNYGKRIHRFDKGDETTRQPYRGLLSSLEIDSCASTTKYKKPPPHPRGPRADYGHKHTSALSSTKMASDECRCRALKSAPPLTNAAQAIHSNATRKASTHHRPWVE